LPKPSRKGISARKRLRQSIAARDRNRSVKSRTRTVINRAIVAVSNDVSNAEDAMRAALSALDRAARRGVIHPNGAARSKSRLLKRYNLAVASSVATAAVAAAEAPSTETPAPEKPRRRNPLARRPAGEAAPPAARRTTTRKPPEGDTPPTTRGRGPSTGSGRSPSTGTGGGRSSS
jgi:small subunit ribosomal protein S20